MDNKKKNFTKKKNEIRTYTKVFQNFNDGLTELMRISEVAADIIEDCESTPAEASARMFDAVADNFPSVFNKSTSFWSINLSSTRCYIKTSSKVSFGWKFKYDVEGKGKHHATNENDIIIKDIEMSITDFGESEDIKNEAEYYGWELEIK